ncbi:MAG: hypothetical protein LBF89_11155 [Bacteroidales bacterium]|jgi:hypothetical protein|nr:hypothetical protein [Bacteroidales bacterium]
MDKDQIRRIIESDLYRSIARMNKIGFELYKSGKTGNYRTVARAMEREIERLQDSLRTAIDCIIHL